MKNLDLETVNLPSGTKIFITESLYTYYKKLWSKCKKPWNAKQILSFWMSIASIRVKLKNEAVSIITHDCDLANLFPNNLLIDDYYGEPRCSSNSWLQLCYVSFSGLKSELFSKAVKGLGCWLLLLKAPSWVFEWALHIPLVYGCLFLRILLA